MRHVKIFFFLVLMPLTLFAQGKGTSPMQKVDQWFEEEKEKTEKGFHKFATLATVAPNQQPSTRMIELTSVSEESGCHFFTHRATQKVEHFSQNPRAALNIWLPMTLRQISLTGTVAEISQNEAEAAWKRMPRFMKITFLASDHKGSIESHIELHVKKAQLEAELKSDIPMPEAFVGYRFTPDNVTFYAIQHQDFPVKEVVAFADDGWTSSLKQP